MIIVVLWPQPCDSTPCFLLFPPIRPAESSFNRVDSELEVVEELVDGLEEFFDLGVCDGVVCLSVVGCGGRTVR